MKLLQPKKIERSNEDKIDIAFYDNVLETRKMCKELNLRETADYNVFKKGGHFFTFGKTILVIVDKSDFRGIDREVY